MRVLSFIISICLGNYVAKSTIDFAGCSNSANILSFIASIVCVISWCLYSIVIPNKHTKGGKTSG